MRKNTSPEPLTVALPQIVALRGVESVVQLVARSWIDFTDLGTAGPSSSYDCSPLRVAALPVSCAFPPNLPVSSASVTIEPPFVIFTLHALFSTSGIRHVPRPNVPT